MPKVAIGIDFPRCSISIFAISTSWIISFKVPVDRFMLAKLTFFHLGYHRNCDLLWNLDWPNLPKGLSSIFIFRQNYGLDFFHQVLHLQFLTCRSMGNEEVIDYINNSGVLLCQRCQSLLLALVFCDTQNQFSAKPQTR